MKKAFMFASLFALLAISFHNPTYAQDKEIIALSPADASSGRHVWLRRVEGSRTGGATFVVHSICYDGYSLNISVSQLPNDENTSLMDNEVLNPDNERKMLIDEAARYGETVIGTYCSITIEDAAGNKVKPLFERASYQRFDSDILTTFCVVFPSQKALEELNVELNFGIDESVSSNFSAAEPMYFSIPVLDRPDIKRITIDTNKETIGLKEIFIAQTPTHAAIYAYSADEANPRHPYTINFSSNGTADLNFTEEDFDHELGLRCNFFSVNMTVGTSHIELYDPQTGVNYAINLLDWTFEQRGK